ncbi:MAG: iron-containing alcohol dehydrogenase [Azonexus sp.]
MNHVRIPSRIHDYDVHIGADLSPLAGLIADGKTVFVVDAEIAQRYAAAFSGLPAERLLCLPARESLKNLETVMQIYRFLLTFDIKRQLHLVSVGGGIIQDVSGFAASTLYRGIHWTFFPTTLLAQADSCVGSKTSLNFDEYKNTLGSFYPPQQVFICTDFLKTLPAQAIDSGVGEIIKFLLLTDLEKPSLIKIAALLEEVRQENYLAAIYETHLVKKSYIQQDEFDVGKRNLFNYGHCFGHALEATSDYAVPHGVAVTIGMWFANILSVERGYLSASLHQHLRDVFFRPNINVPVTQDYLAAEAIIAALKRDKKRVGSALTMILLVNDGMGSAKVDDIQPEEVARALILFGKEWSFA